MPLAAWNTEIRPVSHRDIVLMEILRHLGHKQQVGAGIMKQPRQAADALLHTGSSLLRSVTHTGIRGIRSHGDPGVAKEEAQARLEPLNRVQGITA